MLRLMRPPSSVPNSLELGVRPVFPVESLSKGEAGLGISSRAGAAVASDWADNRRVNRDLGALPKRKAVCDDLDAAPYALQ